MVSELSLVFTVFSPATLSEQSLSDLRLLLSETSTRRGNIIFCHGSRSDHFIQVRQSQFRLHLFLFSSIRGYVFPFLSILFHRHDLTPLCHTYYAKIFKFMDPIVVFFNLGVFIFI